MVKQGSIPYDSIVVGAGPAGSATALHLAQARRRILLLDRHDFPRDKVCGDGLTPRAIDALQQIGIDADELMRQGARCVARYEQVKDGHIRVEYPSDLADGRTYAYALPRLVLDEIIRQRAIEAGANWRGGQAVEAAEFDFSDGTFQIRSSSECFRSRSLIIATGASTMLNAPFVIESSPFTVGIGLRAYFYGPDEVSFSSAFQFHYVSYLPGGCAWIFLVGRGRYNGGVWGPRPRFPSLREAFHRFVSAARASGHLGRAEPIAAPRGSLLGIAPSLHARHPLVAVVGDAGRRANPITGEGISQALASAREAAERILHGLGHRVT